MTTKSKAPKANARPILTTGDVVIDRQMYQGDRIFPTQQGKVAPYYSETVGGAFLLHSIIETCVGKTIAVFGLDATEPNSLPDDLAVHTLWKPCPGGLQKECDSAAPGAKPKPVWRVSEPLGYALSKRQSWKIQKSEAADTAASVVVIDDADLGFRSHHGRAAWTACIDPAKPQPAWIILKMSNPLAQGDLWRALVAPPIASSSPIRQNLVVVITAKEIRRAGAAISHGLSWERTLSELCEELDNHPQFQAILRHARHVVVNFGCVASVWFGDSTCEAGSENTATARHRAKLIYDPTLAEGGWKELMADRDPKEGHSVYGLLNSFTAALAVYLHAHEEMSGGEKPLDLSPAIERGLTAVRLLRRLGHGEVSKGDPAFPLAELASLISPASSDAQTASIKLLAPNGYQRICGNGAAMDSAWTLAALSENPPTRQTLPLYGLAHCVALYGEPALSHLPHARFGALLSIDRAEIETLRSLSRMILAYESGGKQKQPLCLAAFGPPGAGKSFGIKEISRQVLGDKVPILEFNLSQYDDAADLIGAFHQVRDKCLQGSTPVVFWDEFDSRAYEWLQYLLAPMQDGSFQENGHTHTLGKCIFVFAGGTSWDFEHFGPAPMPPDEDQDAQKALETRYSNDPSLVKSEQEANAEFRRKKGPDFVSRLDGHINVLGPNRRLNYNWSERQWNIADSLDITFPVRRALLLRSFLGIRKGKEALSIDRDLLRALIHVPRYRHGARSLEKVAKPLTRNQPPFCRSQLPPPQVLAQHLVTPEDFDALHHLNRAFLKEENVRRMAAAIADYFDSLYTEGYVKRTADEAVAAIEATAASPDPWQQWLVATNIAAAQRLPDILALVGLRLEEGEATPVEQQEVTDHLHRHLHVLAKEEHDLWEKFHRDNGWRQPDKQALERLKSLKETDKDAYKAEIKRLKQEDRIHTLLIHFDDLPESEKTKDHDSIKNYPGTVALVGWKIGFVQD